MFSYVYSIVKDLCNTYVLETNALCKQYKHFKALDNLNMRVPKGTIYGFVGKNGKTTLIRVITGLQNPSSGEYAIYGIGNTDKSIAQSRRRMGAVVETPSVYLDMTANDNLKTQYRVMGMPSFDGIDKLLSLPRIVTRLIAIKDFLLADFHGESRWSENPAKSLLHRRLL